MKQKKKKKKRILFHNKRVKGFKINAMSNICQENNPNIFKARAKPLTVSEK
jgi:hypothetical protein